MALNEIISNKYLLLGFSILAILFVLLLLIARLFWLYRNILNSFSKLSFVIREDSKKYFSKSSTEVTAIQEGYAESTKEIIKQAMNEIINNQQDIIDKVVTEANNQAEQIINKTKEERDRIILEANQQAQVAKDKTLEDASYIIENILTEYTNTQFSINDHEQIIAKSIENYLKKDDQH